MADIDDKYMKEALRQARKGLGRTSPNPAVGAVIVRDGRIVSKGYHKKAGAIHAEVAALEKLGGKAHKEDTLYVTLEPCNHQGRTPPCTETILKYGLKKVVAGMQDPNPGIRGGGCRYLAEKGVKVRTGVLETECRRLNEDFIKYVTSGRPFVIAKTALTLDGWAATSSGNSRWVTGEKSRDFVHRLRDRVDGIMVGIDTVLADNPELTTRLADRNGSDPVRIILDTRLRIPADAKVLNSDSPAETLIAFGDGLSPEKMKRVKKENVGLISCQTKGGRIDLPDLLKKLGERRITSLLVEGGSTLLGAFIRENLIDKFYIFKAPKLLGGNDGVPMASGAGPEKMKDCLSLKDIEITRFGDDILIKAYPDY